MNVMQIVRTLRLTIIRKKFPSLFDVDWITIILSSAIGDRVYVLSFLKEIKKKNPGKKVRVVCEKRKMDVVNFFADEIDEIKLCCAKDFNLLLKGDVLFSKYYDRFLVCHVPLYFRDSYIRIMDYPGFNMFMYIKHCILKLNENAEQYFPQRVFKERVTDIPYIILCPDATSIKKIDIKFWQELKMKLEKLGYRVLVNMTSKEIFKDGEIHVGLSELLELGENAKAIIGLRSGVLDWLLLTKTPLFAIYPDKKTLDFFNLINVNNRPEIYQVVYSEKTIDYIIRSMNE